MRQKSKDSNRLIKLDNRRDSSLPRAVQTASDALIANCSSHSTGSFPGQPFRSSQFCSDHQLHFRFPAGLPKKRSVCIASSRLSQTLEDWDQWFDALRTLAVRLDPEQHFFLTAPKTTADRFVKHLAKRFGFDLVELLPDRASPRCRGKKSGESAVPCQHPGGEPDTRPAAFPSTMNVNRWFPAFYTQSVEAASVNEKTKPNVDQLLLEIASDVYLLHVRKGGNVVQAALRRLATGGESPAKTVCLMDLTMNQAEVQQQLLDAGATGWWLYDHSFSDRPPAEHLTKASSERSEVTISPARFSPGASSNLITPIFKLTEFPTANFLVHWTRACIGPWPDQTEDEFLDDLLFRSQQRHHGERFALCRILATRRIFASHRLTRDRQPVVCFSNRNLADFPSLKNFRPHLGRWDFVPFGIAVERTWIESQGGRPVIYGDEETWKNLADHQRPFFQLAKSKSGEMDWTLEQEWRWLGDLDLQKMPIQSVAVFVPSLEEAQEVASLSNWPVVIIGN